MLVLNGGRVNELVFVWGNGVAVLLPIVLRLFVVYAFWMPSNASAMRFMLNLLSRLDDTVVG